MVAPALVLGVILAAGGGVSVTKHCDAASGSCDQASTTDGKCSDEADCLLNGDCVEGTCECDAGWNGPRCGQLDLEPADDPETASYVAPGGTSSWGMSVAKTSDEDGVEKWHGFVSEFSHGCKLGSWTSNSYVNHIVASTPTGPWTQAKTGIALSHWAHNPRIVHSPRDDKWLLYHIGGPPREPQDCGGDPGPTPTDDMKAAASSSPLKTWPFRVFATDSLLAPKWAPPEPPGVRPFTPKFPQFTLHRGVDNADNARPAGGVHLYETDGGGSLLLNFTQFQHDLRHDGALVWDTCSDPDLKFNNGRLVWEAGIGSRIGSFHVAGAVHLMYGHQCMLTHWYADADLEGPSGDTTERDTKPKEAIDFLKIVPTGGDMPVRLVGRTQDAEGCRGVCAAMLRHRDFRQGGQECSSYTWRAENGECYVRSDKVWDPMTGIDAANSVSGRPWNPYTGDNPAPYVDQETGEVSVLFRTYAEGGSGSSQRPLCATNSLACGASLIGMATAPSWKGPYTMVPGPDAGPVSAHSYPFEENEDPFLWRTVRGWHALAHSNTWFNSHSEHFTTAEWAGRYAFSKDGVSWTYSDTPAFPGVVQWKNGTSSSFERRERPFVLFEDETPVALYTGAQRFRHDEYTFSLIQKIR